ncbi:MAG: response regulator [Acidobacteriota bacterium]|nr:response regulator [Acidobacteriota bacterium]
MIKKTLNVLLIEDCPDYAELVRAWLADEGDTQFVLNWADSLLEGMNTLAKGGIDVVLLDLGLPDSSGPQTFRVIKSAAQSAPIIILSAGESEALALRLVQEGAQDYLVKSSCSSAVLKKAVQFAMVRTVGKGEKPGSVASPSGAKVIGLMGVKGGVGTTTVACNLALEIRRHTEHKTLLADLDIDAGLVNFFMNIETRHSVIDGATNVHLDTACWEGIVAQGASGLHVARSPGRMGAPASDVDRVRHLITLLVGMYQWILLDLGRLNTFSLGLLDQVHELFLVTTTSVPALYEAKRVIVALQKAGFEADRVRLIVNQFGDRNDYSGKELDRLFGMPVYARLPGASQELHDACANAKHLPEDSDFRGRIARLARNVAGQPEAPRSKVAQIFSFAEKFLKRGPIDSARPGV